MFDNLLIRTRIILLVMLSVATVVLVSASFLLSESRVHQASLELKGHREVLELTARVERLATDLRLASDRFSRDRQAGGAADFARVAEDIGKALAILRQHPNAAPKRDQIEKISQGIAAVTEGFARLERSGLALGLDDDSGLRGQMRKSVSAVEAELKAWHNLDQLLRLMETMRRAEFEYLLYGIDAAAGSHRKAFNEFDFGLSSSGMDSTTSSRLATLARAYRQDFTRVVEANTAFRTEVQAMAQALSALRPSFDALLDASRRGMDDSNAMQEQIREDVLVAGIGLSALLVLVYVGLSGLVARSITRPVRAIRRVLLTVAAGNLDTVIPATERGDEVGEMARAIAELLAVLNVLHDSMNRISGRVSPSTSQSRSGNLRGPRPPPTELRGVFAQMQALLVETGGTFRQISLGATRVAISADEASAAVRQVSHGVQAQLGDVEDVGMRLHQATSALGSIIEQSRTLTSVAEQAASSAVQGRADMRGLASLSSDLAQESRKIRRIVDTMRTIAETTNILSVNASIEARRAGLHGLGFETVAGQVRNLAQRSDEAAKQIDEIVEAIAEKAERGASDTQTVLGNIEQIAGQAGSLDDAVRAVLSALAEQNRMVPAIESRMANIRDVAVRNAAAAEQISVTVMQLARQANDTKQSCTRFLSTADDMTLDPD
jgi:methyl-accepting chemotaxis protein